MPHSTRRAKEAQRAAVHRYRRRPLSKPLSLWSLYKMFMSCLIHFLYTQQHKPTTHFLQLALPQMYRYDIVYHTLSILQNMYSISRLLRTKVDNILLDRQLRYTPKLPYPSWKCRILLSLAESADFAFAGNMGWSNREVDGSRYWNDHYRYKHATWYVETGRDDTSLDVLIFLKFKFSNGFFVKSKKKSPNIFDKICKRYGKIRSLNCGENLSSDHTMTIPKWVWGLILPLVRSNDR